MENEKPPASVEPPADDKAVAPPAEAESRPKRRVVDYDDRMLDPGRYRTK